MHSNSYIKWVTTADSFTAIAPGQFDGAIYPNQWSCSIHKDVLGTCTGRLPGYKGETHLFWESTIIIATFHDLSQVATPPASLSRSSLTLSTSQNCLNINFVMQTYECIKETVQEALKTLLQSCPDDKILTLNGWRSENVTQQVLNQPWIRSPSRHGRLILYATYLPDERKNDPTGIIMVMREFKEKVLKESKMNFKPMTGDNLTGETTDAYGHMIFWGFSVASAPAHLTILRIFGRR